MCMTIGMAEPIAISTIVTAKIFAISPSPLASFYQALVLDSRRS